MKISTKRRRRDGRNIMPHLPEDIVSDILLMLPAKAICRFRCVCKHWNHLFKDPDFTTSRLNHSIETEKLKCFSLEDGDTVGFNIHITKDSRDLSCEDVEMDSPFKDTSDIVGSCDGWILMCVAENFERRLCLWNPYTKVLLTRKFRDGLVYFPSNSMNQSVKRSYTYGIGYNCDIDGYTIVVATCYFRYRDDACYGCEIQLYTFESKSWKTLPNIFPYEMLNIRDRKAEAVFVHGAFHWISRQVESGEKCIFFIDIGGENFNKVPVTPQVDELLNSSSLYSCKALCALGGCLCIVQACSDVITVWVAKDYNVRDSWTKLFIAVFRQVGANPISEVKLLWEFKNGEVLFVTRGRGSHDWDCNLVLYDPVSRKCKATKIRYNPGYKWNIGAYVERSLLSLNSDKRSSTGCTQQRSRKSVRLANTTPVPRQRRSQCRANVIR